MCCVCSCAVHVMLNTTELLHKVAAEPAELHTAVDAPTLRKLWNAQASFVHRCLLNGKVRCLCCESRMKC